MPKVSVVIPVYGVEKYIERCAISLFEQKLDDIEFIFVDDCTIDRSIEILRNVIKRYRFRLEEKKYIVRVEKMPVNSGQAIVRKHGTSLATGDFIIHCDPDDWIDENMYEIMYNYAINNGYDVVNCDFYRTNGNSFKYRSRKIPEVVYENNINLLSKMLIGSDLTSLCTKLVRKEIYDKVEFPKYNMQEDAFISFQIFFYAGKIGHIGKCLYYYYSNPLSISRNPSVESYLDRLHQVCENTNKIISFACSNGIYDELYEEIECQKLRARNHIVPLTSKRKFYKMWRETYPEIDKSILYNNKIDKKERCQYFLVRFRVYHILLALFRNRIWK